MMTIVESFELWLLLGRCEMPTKNVFVYVSERERTCKPAIAVR